MGITLTRKAKFAGPFRRRLTLFGLSWVPLLLGNVESGENLDAGKRVRWSSRFRGLSRLSARCRIPITDPNAVLQRLDVDVGRPETHGSVRIISCTSRTTGALLSSTSSSPASRHCFGEIDRRVGELLQHGVVLSRHGLAVVPVDSLEDRFPRGRRVISIWPLRMHRAVCRRCRSPSGR